MVKLSSKRHRFPPEFIQHAVWLYARFTLLFHDVEDLLAERGIDVSNETVLERNSAALVPEVRAIGRQKPGAQPSAPGISTRW